MAVRHPSMTQHSYSRTLSLNKGRRVLWASELLDLQMKRQAEVTHVNMWQQLYKTGVKMEMNVSSSPA